MGSDPAQEGASLGIRTGSFTRTILGAIRDAGHVYRIAEVWAKRAGRPLDNREFGLVAAQERDTPVER